MCIICILLVFLIKYIKIIIWKGVIWLEKPDLLTSFSQDVKNKYWGVLKPDIGDAFEIRENLESWTYTVSEFPKLFIVLYKLFTTIVQFLLSSRL
jgi:hypothetical protein